MNNFEMIKELRGLTQAGMKDCKDALEESSWDLQKAVDIVKAKGLSMVAGRANKVAAEGKIAIGYNEAADVSYMVEVNCQTDFVANSKPFAEFVKFVSDRIGCLLGMPDVNGVIHDSEIKAKQEELCALTKENIVFKKMVVESGKRFSYLHSNGKIGVLLNMTSAEESAKFNELGENIAMQIAAMNPLTVNSSQIKPEDLDRQSNIFKVQIDETNQISMKIMPPSVYEKIISGKLRKWFSEVCLVNQNAVFTSNRTIQEELDANNATIFSFTRFEVGENIEKPQEKLAEEVAKLMQ